MFPRKFRTCDCISATEARFKNTYRMKTTNTPTEAALTVNTRYIVGGIRKTH